MSTYLLLDGHSLAYRAWFALKDSGLATSSGQQTQAVYGFVAMTTRLVADFAPEGMAVAFDRAEPTFRDAISPTYKAGRPETPAPLVQQVEWIRRFVEALGVPALDAVGYEADDVLATLATVLGAAGKDVVIVTGDRDSFQLVEDPHIRVLYNRRGVTDYTLYDEAGILERTGVAPASYPMLAALRGDPSDNLPGVPGVGEKTAAKLVNAYGDVDGLYANLERLTPKLAESLRSSEGQVRSNLQLIPVVRDLPIEIEAGDLAFGQSDREVLARLFSFLEMRTPGQRLFSALDGLEERLGTAGRDTDGVLGAKGATGVTGSSDVPGEPAEKGATDVTDCSDVVGEPTAASAPGLAAGNSALGSPSAPGAPGELAVEREALSTRVLDEVEEAARVLMQLDAAGCFVAAEPAWAGTPGRSALLGIALCAGEEPTEALLLAGEILAEEPVAGALTSLLGDRPRRRLVAHRAKELMRGLGASGIDVNGLDLDSSLAAYLLDPSQGSASIEELATLGASRHRVGPGSEPSGEPGAAQLGFDLAQGSRSLLEAAARRCERLARLAPALRSRLAEAGATRLYEEVERPLTRVLAKMELAGIVVDAERLTQIHSALTAEARDLVTRAQELAGEPFNVGSTIQLRSVLFDKLKLTPQRKTKTGYSTDAATLERLRGQHEIVETLIRYREVEKLRSTYGEGLVAEIAPDGRIHATFNQTVARTGRLSSDRPNLHNIPVRTEEGRRFREAFVAPSGSGLLVADYNQIELRVIAHLSGDPGLVAAFAEGRDVHVATAAGVFGVGPGEVTREQRERAKMVSYGLAYGMEAYGLGQRLNIPVTEAQAILEQYFAAFPAVRSYMDDVVRRARAAGYTETLLGRRRYLPELASDSFQVRQAAERQAMNSGIQGLAADIFKIALVHLDAALAAAGCRSRIVLQVHDEVLVEALDDEREEAEALCLDAMRNAFPLSVPLEVHAAWGRTWAEAKSG